MSDNELNELVANLRGIYYHHGFSVGGEGADAIESLRRDLENERARGIHTCHDRCDRPMCVLRRERDALRARVAELEAALANREAAGFVLVPKDATGAMITAGAINWSGYEEETGRDFSPTRWEVLQVWDAMLAAAQQAAKEGA